MLGINSIIALLHQSSIAEETALPVLKIGDYVWIDTLCYGTQLGKVEAVVPSPFYGEDWMCAFVVGNGWTEYVRIDVEVK